MSDLISRKAAITLPVKPKEHREYQTFNLDDAYEQGWNDLQKCIELLPAAQPEKEIPRRVRWSGWKGDRYTRYWCPNCEKPVRNDDDYCHRCGQKIMFPQISFSKYVPGEKQQTIVTWEDDNG